VVVALPEKKKERLCERKVVSVCDCLDDTVEIENGVRYRRFMKFDDELKGFGTPSYPDFTLMHR
jgi:hypothetical protein